MAIPSTIIGILVLQGFTPVAVTGEFRLRSLRDFL